MKIGWNNESEWLNRPGLLRLNLDGFDRSRQSHDGLLDSNEATVSINVEGVNDAPELSLNGGAVTFSAKANKHGAILVFPNVTLTEMDQTPELGIGGGTLTLSIAVSAKVKKNGVKLDDTIGGLSSASSLGMATSPTFANGKLALSIALNADTTAAAVQAFLRGITFQTKGNGVKLAQRILQAQVTDAAGAASNLLQQAINVTK